MVRLGQNFLADTNLLEAIVRDARLAGDEVVLEVGGGEGALTELLAAAAAHVHVIELDRRLRDSLEDVAAGHSNVSLLWADAMDADLEGLDPPPTAMVANLPYSVATPLLIRTIAVLPRVAAWTVMVQREIAERLRATPGSKSYGAPSVTVQLACTVELVRKIDPAVFRPRPRVDSALIRLERTGPGCRRAARRGGAGRLRAPPQGAGGLAGACGSGIARGRRGRPGAHRPRSRRPRRGPGACGVRGAGRGARVILRAPAKLNLGLFVGPVREDGLHEIRSLFCPLLLADSITVSDAEVDAVHCPGLEGPNLAAAALAGLRELGWDAGPVRLDIDKRIPVAAGLGGGSADAAAVLRLARHLPGVPELALRLGADVPSQLEPRFSLVAAAGESVEPLPAPADFGVVAIPGERGLRTADVYSELERNGLARDADDLAAMEAQLREAASRGSSPLEYAELLRNDLEAPALSLEPEIAPALEALREAGAECVMVAGSGPTAIGLCADLAAADRVAAALPPRYAGAITSAPGGAS